MEESTLNWVRVGDAGSPSEGDRLHTCVDGRYVTIFRHNGKLSVIDSICHHAGGPMTLGKVEDIEDLGGLRVVLCPWHKFMVTIDGGLKVYQAVSFVDGKPQKSGWTVGKIVQRPHAVEERDGSLYVALVITDVPCVSDKDACSSLCAQAFQGASGWMKE
eukprot:gene4470-8902_t